MSDCKQVTGKLDLISRQAAIGAVNTIRRASIIEDGEELVRRSAVKYVIESEPSAEPETSSSGSISCMKSENTHVKTTDGLISRQAAIDLVKNVCDAIMSGCDSHYDPETMDEVYNDILEVDAILKCNKEIRIALANLPSAQLYTPDELQAIQDLEWAQMEKMYELGKAERKKGKWINHLNDDGHHIADCSKCGHALQWFDDEDEPKYCCMCGSYNGGKVDAD